MDLKSMKFVGLLVIMALVFVLIGCSDLFIKNTLNVTTQGEGNVTIEPQKPLYDRGEKVVLTAVPEEGWLFKKWSGSIDTDVNPVEFTMDSVKDIKALFKLPLYDDFEGQSLDESLWTIEEAGVQTAGDPAIVNGNLEIKTNNRWKQIVSNKELGTNSIVQAKLVELSANSNSIGYFAQLILKNADNETIYIKVLKNGKVNSGTDNSTLYVGERGQWDVTVPHEIRIERNQDQIKVYLDENIIVDEKVNAFTGNCKIILETFTNADADDGYNAVAKWGEVRASGLVNQGE